MSHTVHDRRLEQHYRKVMIAIALPIIVVVLGLAFIQYWQHRSRTIEALSQGNTAIAHALDSIAKQADVHVEQMRTWAEGNPTNPPKASDLGSYFTALQTPGMGKDDYMLDRLPEGQKNAIGQVLWTGGDPHLSTDDRQVFDQALEFFHILRLTHTITPLFQWSYIIPASRDHLITYPWVSGRKLMERKGCNSIRCLLAKITSTISTSRARLKKSKGRAVLDPALY